VSLRRRRPLWPRWRSGCCPACRRPSANGWFATRFPASIWTPWVSPGPASRSGCHEPDAQEIHDALADAGTTIVAEPFDGPFGRTFTFADPDGYQVTLHSDG
jgi:hypothetical protein